MIRRSIRTIRSINGIHRFVSTGMPCFKPSEHVEPSAYTQKVRKNANSIDVRSDTVTQPSDEMRKAMAEAIVGDDVYGEDATTTALEERCARLFGKEKALFVVSGTMGNLLAVMAHCQRGDEIIVGRYNHIHRWEQGNYAQIGGICATTLEVNDDGTMDLDDIEQAIRVQNNRVKKADGGGAERLISDIHMPTTRLICIENTHNYTGGKALPVEWMKQVKQLAERRNLLVHMDGARIYNAAVAQNTTVEELCKYTDTVQMCFSKGLGAPIGSVIAGPAEFIDKTKKIRKAMGGGWRQAGIMAAAAHVALDRAEITIKKDHERTEYLAKKLNEITPAHLKNKVFACEKDLTNMVLVHCENGVNVKQLSDHFQAHDILVMGFDAKRIRMVINWDINDEHIEKIIQVYDKFIKTLN